MTTYLGIHQEVVAMLFAFGYKPKVIVNKPNVGYVDVCFHVDNGYDSMPTHHKDAISMLAKGYLSEFYYCGDIQHVYLRKECKGLEPDDDRYGCLLHEIRLVNSEEPLLAHGLEVFVNMCDHFKRFRKWKDVTSKE